jgi:aspartate/methionine/tyrosine aminotransferase
MFLTCRLAITSVSLVALAIGSTTTAFVPDKLNRPDKSGAVSGSSSSHHRLFLAKSSDDDPAPDGVGGLAHSVGEATLRLGLNTGPTVWTEFGRISQEHNPVNLGQGFPDWLPPKFAVDSLVEAVLDTAQSPHQYTRPAGHPSLVNQLARRYSIHLKREISAMDEVAVTVGASQALYLSLQTLIQPGDEVILFEPFFDLYVNQIRLAGGTPVYVPLRFDPYGDSDSGATASGGGDWNLDRDELMKVVSPKTKAIILNSPHNPTGKIFTRNEMEIIAESLDLAGPACVVLSDEVYKYIVHAPPQDEFLGDSPLCPGHTHFASLPGMWDRTITISSAGKTFSATGWQVGWCVVDRGSVRPGGCEIFAGRFRFVIPSHPAPVLLVVGALAQRGSSAPSTNCCPTFSFALLP